jgi:hypothetical protein
MRLSIDGSGGGVKLFDDTAKECLHTAFLRGSKRVGDEEVGQAEQSLADGLQAFLAVHEWRRGGGAGARLGSQKIQGSFQKGATVLFVRHPVGADQSESFAKLQAVAVDAGQKAILLCLGDGAQGVSDGGAENSGCQRVLRRGGEMCGDLLAAGDPLGLSLQQSSDCGGTQSILVNQGGDHARLIECREGAGRGIGRQEQPFLLRG